MFWIGFAVVLAIVWWRLYGPDISYAALRRQYAAADSRFLALADGIVLHYRAAGAPDRPALLLLHGYGDSFTSWEGWVETLRPHYRVLVLDLPGHGLTEAPPTFQLSSQSYLQIIHAFVTELGIGKLSLVGNSMGGGLAWLYASSYPQQVQSLVLVDAAGWPLPPTDQLPIAFRILQYRLGRWFLSQIDNTPLIQQGLRQNVHDSALITPVLVSRWAALQRAPGHRRILMSASPTSFAAATVERLKAIQSPTLVMHGEKDSLIPIEHGRLFASHIENAILISYPDVGHLPQIEIPQRSAHDALRFLQETEANT